jgi:hypothetical protein
VKLDMTEQTRYLNTEKRGEGIDLCSARVNCRLYVSPLEFVIDLKLVELIEMC